MAEEFEPATLRIPASGGKSFSEIQRDADRAVAKKTSRFVQYLAKDLKDIQAMLAVYLEDPSQENMRPIFDRIHNLRGQGAMFDYPLVTTIGGHFCRYIDNLPPDVSPRKDVVVTFINSLKVVQAQKIKGEGPENFKILIENMGLMVTSLISK